MYHRTTPVCIQFVKKKRTKGEKHLPFGAQLSCELCWARFTTQTAYNAHLLLPTHQSRLKWLEIKKWMKVEGQKFLHARDSEEFEKHGMHNGGRRSRMNFDETFNPGIVPPPIHPPASEIPEPSSNRWPYDIKPSVYTKKKIDW